MLMSGMVFAKYHRVGGQKDFEKLINKYQYSVVCFAPSDVVLDGDRSNHEKRRELRSEFKSLEEKVRAAADRGNMKRYLTKDVGFMVVDVASKRAREVDVEYALDKFPTCLVFKQGELAKSTSLFAPTSSRQIVALLEKNFGPELEKMTKDRREDERLAREERIASVYSYPMYGWGGPYYYGGYYGWRRPYYFW